MEATTQERKNIQKKIKILFYNKFFKADHIDYSRLNIPNVEISTEDDYGSLAELPEVDVVIFHIPSLELKNDELIKLKRANQLWVYWSFECDAHFPSYQDPEVKRLFEIIANYELDADVPMPYISYCANNWRQEPVAKTGFINAFFSNTWDKSGRYAYLSELMAYLPVDSYGQVLNNKKIPKNDPYSSKGLSPDSYGFKEEVISKYKFTLAFENAVAKDYVTEKFFQPLIMGSVPVYLGAPNVDDFAPGDHAYIDITKFSSTKELADYLLKLDHNDELYNQYLQWKKQPFRNEFETKIRKYIPDHPLRQIVAVLRERYFS